MNIEQKKIDSLSTTLSVAIEPLDYTERVNKSLHDFRRNAEIKGFRKGMVPMGLIQKMHGRTALLEEVNKLLSEGINKYINDNNIKIIGEPLPSEDHQEESIDWEHDDTFTFAFDMILAPQVEVNLTLDDHVSIRQPEISQKEIDEYVSSLCKQHGQLVDVEAAGEEDFLKVDLLQGDKEVKAAFISLQTIKTKEHKEPFMGLKVGDSVEIDIPATFTNDTDRAALLKVKKEELTNYEPIWKIDVLEVKHYTYAELNQDLYDRIFGPGQVDSSTSFMEKIEARMRSEFEAERDYRLMCDIRDYLIDKCAIELPDALIKRWLHFSNDGKFSMEDIERDYDAFVRDFRWQLIKGHLMETYHIEISKEEMSMQAIELAKYRFAMYGLNSVPKDHLEQFAANILSDQKEARRILEQIEERKVVDQVRTFITLDPVMVPFSQKHTINESVSQ